MDIETNSSSPSHLKAADQGLHEAPENDQKSPLFDRSFEPSFSESSEGLPTLRAKTSLRMVYEAQAEVIRRQIGELDEVREKLGLNARKICQLLMVDPSAWNRWTRTGQTAPPHVWRALQWYMIVQEKLPGLTPQFFIERIVPRVDRRAQDWVENLGQQTQKLDQEILELQSQSQRLLSQVEEQVELIRSQEKRILQLQKTLVLGLSLCFALGAGLFLYFTRIH